jgi:Protein of unknown function (DUF3987)
MRKLSDWISGFIELGHTGEAPDHVLFWSGVSAIAGALGRKVWIDELNYKVFPNMYIVIVAPPGIIAKTTTTGLAMDILRKVDGVSFGPNFTTWQALVESFEGAERIVDYGTGESVETNSLTIHSGEMGNLISPDDKQMMDALNTLWDCGVVDKATKKDGRGKIEYPFLNLIACTTPSWISGSFPPYMIYGGLVSRIVWVYAEYKARLIANPIRLPKEALSANKTLRRYLTDDLNDIGRLEGPFVLSEDAFQWSEEWYKEHWSKHKKGKDDSRLGGFHSRKQGHIYKLAMALSASRGDSRVIELVDMLRAEREVSALELTLLGIFDRIGKSETANISDRMVEFIARAGPKGVTPEEAYAHVRSAIPKPKDFDEIWKGLKRSGTIEIKVVGGRQVFIAPQA